MRSSRIGRYLLALCLTSLTLWAFGCSENSPFAPDGEPEYLVNPSFVQMDNPQLGTMQACISWTSIQPTELARKMVSSRDGGVVRGGRYTLTFPKRSLPYDAEIVIKEYWPDILVWEMEPHGIVFSRPVKLTVDLSGTSAAGSRKPLLLLYYNEELRRWEIIPSRHYPKQRDPNKFEAYLKHFSRYALAN